MTTDSTTTADDATLFLGEAWSDPIETGIRDRIRGFIEELIEEELAAALGRGRYQRRQGRGDGEAGPADGPPAGAGDDFFRKGGDQPLPALDRDAQCVVFWGATGVGLALLLLRRSPWAAAAAIILFASPHLVGAPQLAEVQTNVPEALAHQFVVAVTLTSLLFWALLGSLSGALYHRVAV